MVALVADFNVSRDIEEHIDTLAVAGRTCAVARNALYELLAFKIQRFTGPLLVRFAAVGEVDQVQVIAFLVFAEMVIGWGGEGSFVRFFLGFFKWRLRHALEKEERRSRRQVRWSEQFE